MPEWITVAATTEIAPGHGKAVNVVGATIAIFNVDGKFLAVDNTCPHQGGPLSEGKLDGPVVTCPWHGWRYDVRTGCPVLTPTVQTFEIRTSGSAVQVGIPPEQCAQYEHDQDERQRGAGSGGTAAVHDTLEQIQQARTLDDVIEKIYVGLQAVLPHNRLGIALIDEASGKLVQVKTRSDRTVLLNDGFSAQISGSSLERILALGEARLIDDLPEQYAKRPSAWTKLIVDEGMRSSLTLPLKVEGRPIGVVFFTSVTPRAFTESHVGFLKQIAGQLSILIEKGRWVSELAQTNERYRILFEMSNEGIFLCPSASDTFLTVNGNLCAWLGYTSEELHGLSLAELIGPERFHRIKDLLDEQKDRATPVVFETELFKKDAGTFPVEIRVLGITHRGRRFLQGFVRDLSELQQLNAQLRRQYSFASLIGKSRAMQDVYDLIRQVAPMSTTVLIQGESGTGKELVARAIHQNSARRKKPFVAVNCGALVDTLLESELFGHVRGAFTGATNTRQGRFEVADGGTIFLDEVADLSPATQVKLLRVLQEGEFEKVGSTSWQHVDVRIIAATNRNLKDAIRSGKFREDLFYRLNVVPVVIPPLRDRREDIPLLIEHFIRKFNRETGKSIESISSKAFAILSEHPYPGNVRELENVIEHGFVKCQGSRIEKTHLPHDLSGSPDDVIGLALTAEDPLAALERELIRRILQECNGNPRHAARRLGISRTTLWRRLRAAKPSA